jgi:2-(1,2-epoxy-1,2-dihydrophenyl)acetyl-CoA isomerase
VTEPELLETEVAYERDTAGVAWITINRSDRGNALTPAHRDRIVGLLADASSDLAVRAVAVRSVGRNFCTGADLSVDHTAGARPEGAPDRPAGSVRRTITNGAQSLISAVLDCDKPVVAAVQGAAAGIGSHLALACDLVVAAEGSRFIEVFVRRGISVDGGGTYLLPRLIGVRRATELMMLGDDLPGSTALEWGLVNRVVPPDDLIPTVTELAQRLAGGPTVALATIKLLVNRSLDDDRAANFALEAVGQEAVMQSEDANEGVASFLEGRPAHYRGW